MKDSLFPIVGNINTIHHMNRLSEAEYIWQSAERSKKRSILVNFPGGYPPNIERGIVVDGTGPFSSPLSNMSTWDRFCSHPERTGEVEITVSEAKEWKNLPNSDLKPLESMLDLSGLHSYDLESDRWIQKTPSGSGEGDYALPYYLLLMPDSDGRYGTIVLSKEKDFNKKTLSIKIDQMSDWIYDRFSPTIGERIYDNMIVRKTIKADLKGKFRLRLVELSPDGRRVVLDRTPIYNLDGWVHPQKIADELIDDLGLDRLSLDEDSELGVSSEKSPLCQVYEPVSKMVKGLIKTCSYLTSRYDWDLLFTQIHAPDGIHHDVLNGICAKTPSYSPEREAECWEKLRETYRDLDDYVGGIVSNCSDENTTVIVVSDHGCIPTRKRVAVDVFLEKQGLIKYREDKNGRLVIDIEKSKIISGFDYVSHSIWINLEGRDPGGIVKQSEYEETRERVIDILNSIKDPETGERVIALALRREDAEIFGHYGSRAGDILYLFKEGYSNKFSNGITGIDPRAIPESGFETVTEGPEYGRHHSYLPTTRYCGCSVRAIYIMSGPGIKKNYRRRTPIRTIDVAPTMAFIAGIPFPRDNDGLVFADAFDEST
jgi:predicted AlkP superfamily phosphohydrolase/phosphomutase